eukprot:COSAG05_NODE_2475_length_3014_cov_3.392453_2_plen_32_part_00
MVRRIAYRRQRDPDAGKATQKLSAKIITMHY